MVAGKDEWKGVMCLSLLKWQATYNMLNLDVIAYFTKPRGQTY
jgi:hypothetical protein